MRTAFAALAICVLVPYSSIAADDPLRFIPDQADLVIKVENPRRLIEGFLSLPAVKNAERLDVVRQALDSAPARRAFELIAYYERDLGAKWPELLDQLAGGGIAVASKIKNGVDDPVLTAIQGTDEKVVARFLERAIVVLEEEAGRTDAIDKLERGRYQDVDVLKFGKDLHLCRIGKAVLISNKAEALEKGIDQHLQNISKGGKPAANMANSSSVAAARKLLPANPELWFWHGLDYAKSQPDAKDVLKTPRDNTILTFLFAGYLDVARRSDYVAGGLFRDDKGYTLSVRMPAGREGMADDVELHLPRDEKIGGTLPLLEPKGVMFSHSFYLDLGALWTKRDKIMNAQNVKDFEKGVKEASRFLPGDSIDQLLVKSGVHHRFVVANVGKLDYAIEPKVKLPGFGFVSSMRDPTFGKSAELIIRAAGFLASTQVTLKLIEEKHGEITIVGYRFPEDGKFPDDPQNLRFNFMPAFAVVKDQFIAASTVDLCRELIDIVQKEDRAKPLHPNMRMRAYADGGSAFLNASPEALLTATILNQAIPEAEAKKQVEMFLKQIRQLGSAWAETDYTDKQFRFDLRWEFGK
jgi:hypothetical protein